MDRNYMITKALTHLILFLATLAAFVRAWRLNAWIDRVESEVTK